MRSAVVTGASTGIGLASARVLRAAGWRVFGSVRREQDGERLIGDLGERFTPLLFDVTDAAAVGAAAERVRAELGGAPLDALVNNAGIAVAGPLLHLNVADLRRQLEVNVTGQLCVTQAFAPLIPAGGRIVMMSSVGGRNAMPFVGPYNASKFALEGLSEALRRELMLHGIDVIVVAPGTISTPIWDKADEMDDRDFAHTPYAAVIQRLKGIMIEHGRNGLPAESVGRLVLKALTTARPKTRYVIAPDPLMQYLLLRLPKRMVDRMIAKRIGLR